MTQKTMQNTQRPLSPHMQIYRWHVMMVVSILHRVTGVALAAGTALLVGWLWSAAYSPQCFQSFNNFFASILGKTLLFGWSAAFYFHFCNGIRHLFWDAGKGFEIARAERSAWAVFIFSAVFTICTWASLLAGVK